jgi:predicted small secreted protein
MKKLIVILLLSCAMLVACRMVLKVDKDIEIRSKTKTELEIGFKKDTTKKHYERNKN